jgi:hypothetical protein
LKTKSENRKQVILSTGNAMFFDLFKQEKSVKKEIKSLLYQEVHKEIRVYSSSRIQTLVKRNIKNVVRNQSLGDRNKEYILGSVYKKIYQK